MPAVQDIDGSVVRLLLRLVAGELDRASGAIDVINVFPVADTDTGTNTHKTIASAAAAVPAIALAKAAALAVHDTQHDQDAGHVAGRAPGVDVICYDGGMTDSLPLIGAE